MPAHEPGRALDAMIHDKVMGGDMTKPDGFKVPMWLPHYSTDIAAAWQVMDRLRESGDVLSLNWYPDAGAWECVVHRLPHGHGEAATVALAICLGALDAVGVEV